MIFFLRKTFFTHQACTGLVTSRPGMPATKTQLTFTNISTAFAC